MFETSVDKVDQQSEAKLYEIITQFMRIFRDIFKSSEAIISNIANSSSCSNHLNHFSNSLLTLKLLLQTKILEFNAVPSQQMTYLRLASRLADIIKICKYSNKELQLIGSFYAIFVNKAEKFINTFKKQGNLRNFFQDFFYLSTNFCNGCRTILQDGQVEKAIALFSKKIKQEQQNLSLKRTYSQQNKIEKDGPILPTPISSESQSKTSFMKCIDIDHNYLRSMMYLGNNQKDELYRMMAQKNILTQRMITSYSNQFQEFIKRRARGVFRSTRQKQVKSLHQNTLSSNFKIKNGLCKTINPLRINTQLSISSFQDIKNKKDIKQTKPETKVLRATDNITVGQEKKYDNNFQPIKKTYFHFNPQVIQPAKVNKSRSHNKLRTISSSKIYSLPKDIKYGSKTPKFLQKQLQIHQSALQIKQLNKNNLQIQNIDQTLYKNKTIDSESQQKDESQSIVTTKIGKSRSIRDKRKIQMTKIKHNIQVNSKVQLQQKLSRTDPNSPLKKQLWIKQLQFY